MLQCAIYHENRQLVGFRDDDYPAADIINIGFDSRCEVKLPETPAAEGVLFSIVRLEGSFLAVTASTHLFQIDGRSVSEVIPKPGMDLKIGAFRIVFLGGGESSRYSLLWVIGKNKPAHAVLANGVNLIGSGKNCWIQIESSDLPELCCHCRVESNEISIEPLVESCKIQLLGKTLSANTRIENGEVFKIGDHISAMIIETEDIAAHLKAADPFYPNKTFWQMVLLISMFVFVGICYFHTQNAPKIKPGILVNTGSDLPEIKDGVDVKAVIKNLEKSWEKDIAAGIIKSVNSDIDALLAQKLPKELKTYLQNRSTQLKVSSAATRDIRYYHARRLIYSLEASVAHMGQFEIAGQEWRCDIEDNLMYWGTAERQLKSDRQQAVDLGANSDWALIRDIDKELAEIEKKMIFYRKNREVCNAFISEQFTTAHELISDPEFEDIIKHFPDYERVKKEIEIGNELMLLSRTIQADNFAPENIQKMQERAAALHGSINGIKKWGHVFPLEKTKKTLSQLESALTNFLAVSQLVSTWEKSMDIGSMIKALHGIAELRIAPMFRTNEYVERYNKRITDLMSAILTDPSMPLSTRSDLLTEAMRLPEINDQQKGKFAELSYKLESSSNQICDNLYKRWQAEPEKRKALAAEILKNSLAGSSYRTWAEQQLAVK